MRKLVCFTLLVLAELSYGEARAEDSLVGMLAKSETAEQKEAKAVGYSLDEPSFVSSTFAGKAAGTRDPHNRQRDGLFDAPSHPTGGSRPVHQPHRVSVVRQ